MTIQTAVGKIFVFAFVCAALLSSFTAQAADVTLGDAAVVSVPKGWNTKTKDFSASVDAEVRKVLDCAANPSADLKMVGWKKDTSGKVSGAFCLSHSKNSKNSRIRDILKDMKGKAGEAAAQKVADSFAGEIHNGYKKLGMTLNDISADFYDMARDVVMILGGTVSKDNAKDAASFTRASTVFFHHDTILNIAVLYPQKALASVVKDLEGLPTSVKWK